MQALCQTQCGQNEVSNGIHLGLPSVNMILGLGCTRGGEVGVCVSINTRNQSSLGFYNLISGGDNRERIEEAFESDDVVWGARPERTISVTFPWDRTNQRVSIEWQFNTLMRVKGVRSY